MSMTVGEWLTAQNRLALTTTYQIGQTVRRSGLLNALYVENGRGGIVVGGCNEDDNPTACSSGHTSSRVVDRDAFGILDAEYIEDGQGGKAAIIPKEHWDGMAARLGDIIEDSGDNALRPDDHALTISLRYIIEGALAGKVEVARRVGPLCLMEDDVMGGWTADVNGDVVEDGTRIAVLADKEG